MVSLRKRKGTLISKLSNYRYLILSFLVLGVTACATFDPEKNRIITENSTAIVGPLLDKEVLLEKETVSSDGDVALVEPGKAKLEKESKAKKIIEQSPEVRGDKHLPQVDIAKSKPKPKTAPKKIVSSALKLVPKSSAKKVNQKTAFPVPVAKARTPGRVEGKITIVDTDINKSEKTAKKHFEDGFIVRLIPKDGQQLEQDPSENVFSINMEEKAYTPRYSNIKVNDRLRFVNNDPFKHNVFSSTGTSAFDLGTYGSGKVREVSFNETGIVKVYCNIHANMATFVAVTDENSISLNVGEDGAYAFNNLPAGSYELKVWNLRGETSKTVNIRSGKVSKKNVVLTVSRNKPITHKNKFGKKYKKASLFDDEFY